MRAVLGIDAAWTPAQPSGVALVAEQAGRWRLLSVAPSYAEFLDDGVGRFDAAALIEKSAAIAGTVVTLVAADIPLARSPIVGRRSSDNLVSAEYGARYASTHSPSVTRPGPVSTEMKVGFERVGYELRTQAPVEPGLIEVYPHPALIELSGAPMRLPYKEGKISKYWPDLAMPERRFKLLEQWGRIIGLLDAEIEGVRAAFPPVVLPLPRRQLKAVEDALDAVVCAWVGDVPGRGVAG